VTVPGRALVLIAVLAVSATVAAPARSTEDVLRLRAARPATDSALQSAYAALMAGDLTAAETGYVATLARDARNAHALHGLAAIAASRGDDARAEAWYRRALEADPADAVAHAGLHGIGRLGNAVADESRLKTLAAQQPSQHVLRFALGNLHAANERWHEARVQYQLAHAADPGQPDYLFNLAVSLEQLGELRLARERYEAALAAAARRPAGFDPTQTAASLHQLPR